MKPSAPTAACCSNLATALPRDLFKALADPSRVELLAWLLGADGARTVSAAADQVSVDVSVVSRHLAMLRDAGVLQSEKRGRQVFYSVRCGALAQTLRALADAVEQCCAEHDKQCGVSVPADQGEDDA